MEVLEVDRPDGAYVAAVAHSLLDTRHGVTLAVGNEPACIFGDAANVFDIEFPRSEPSVLTFLPQVDTYLLVCQGGRDDEVEVSAFFVVVVGSELVASVVYVPEREALYLACLIVSAAYELFSS